MQFKAVLIGLRVSVKPLPGDHPNWPSHKTGLLLVNLGTPDATDKKIHAALFKAVFV